MKAPLLEENKCSILIAEYATGHVFKKDLTLFRKGDNEEEVYQFFENFDDADIFVLNFIINDVNPLIYLHFLFPLLDLIY